MSPYLLHRIARQSQLDWHRQLAGQRLLAFFLVVAIPIGAIVALYLANAHW